MTKQFGEKNSLRSGKDAMMSRDRRISITVLLCFSLSGFLGLIYEIVWIRKLGLIFGTTVFAVTTVLAAFFGGLALGSLLLGRLASNTGNPAASSRRFTEGGLLKVYAFLQVAIGVFALLFPIILQFSGWFYSLLYPYIYRSFFLLTFTRFLLFAFLLIFPTTMMGGSLPVLSQYFIRSRKGIGKKLAMLYALNTLGAAAGAFLCGFYFIRYLGVNTTNYLAGIASIAVASIAYLSGRAATQPEPANPAQRQQHDGPPQKKAVGSSNPALKYISLCFFLSGFAAIAYEVIWTRYLSLPLMNTRYTYTIILTVFLLGIGIGSMVLSRFIGKIKNKVRFFACLEIGIGFFAFALGPIVYLLATKMKFSLFGSAFLASGILMLIPTIFMGATFPVVVEILTTNVKKIGYSTGKLYAINTLGCILGSITAGFLLLPILGIKVSLNIVIAINILIGFFCLFRDSRKNWIFNATAVALVAVALLLCRVYLSAQVPKGFLEILKAPSEEIVFIEEGLENTIWLTVNQQNQQKSVWANQTVLGRTRAEGVHKISPQRIAGHIPVLLHKGEPKRVLGICLGTGQTFGSILNYNIEKMDVVEISRAIVDIALEHFKDENEDIGNDERTTIITEDGRNYIAHTRNMYDIITLEPSPPEEAGIVNLYTKEFYQLSRKRLNENGVMSQWLPIYNVHPDETARIVKTFIHVFPDSILWYNGADLILLGFNGEIQIDTQKIESFLRKDWGFSSGRNISRDLGMSYLGDKEHSLNRIENLLAGFLMGPEELKKFSHSGFASELSVITDNHPDLEYTFLKYKTLKNRQEWLKIYNAEKLEPYLTPLQSYLPHISKDKVEEIEGTRAKYVAHLYAQSYSNLAKGEENLEESINLCKKALEYNPSYSVPYSNLGVYYHKQGREQEALSAYKEAVRLSPDFSEAWYGLGGVYWSLRNIDDAINAWNKAVKIKPGFAEAYNNLGSAHAASERYNVAIRAYKKAVKVKPDYANAYYNLGLVYEDTLQRENAIAAYRSAVEVEPGHRAANARLGSLLQALPLYERK